MRGREEIRAEHGRAREEYRSLARSGNRRTAGEALRRMDRLWAEFMKANGSRPGPGKEEAL